MAVREHWQQVYGSKADDELSWTQSEPRLSLALLADACPPPARVLDVGGGASRLAGRLLKAGYDVAVLDIAPAALDRAAGRLGPEAARVRWIEADVTDESLDLGTFDAWHDRAVFHFLTDSADRSRYVALLERTVRPGGCVVIATFAPEGPPRCSGLEVRRYDAESLAAELGSGFTLVKSEPETHVTPWGKPQAFQYALLRRK